MKPFYFVGIVIIFGVSAKAQNTSRNFSEITRETNAYFERHGKKTPGYKTFKRWEWYNETRLLPNMQLANTQELNLQALRQSNLRGNQSTDDVNSGGWTSVGPTSVSSTDRGIGRVNRLAFHPTNQNILYAASATGGLWITTDAGANWYSYSEGIPNMSLSGVAVNYDNTNEIYVLTGDADAINGGARGQFSYGKSSTGVLKSTNGGFNWQQTSLQFAETDNIACYKMLMHRSNPYILIVAGNNGIWRTTNAGATWNQMNANVDFYDLEFHPNNNSIVYASGTLDDSIVLYRSTNDGQSFSKASAIKRQNSSDGDGARNRSTIAVSAANPDYVYLLAGPSTAVGSFQGVYRSTNQGSTFTLRTATPNLLGRDGLGQDDADQEGYDLALAVNPGNSALLVTGGIRVWTSSNSGSSFSYQDNYVSTFDHYHDDIHELIYHPLNSSRLYMCADGGVYLSVTNGETWMSLNNNFPISQYYKIATNPGNALGQENIIIGGLQDNGTNMRGPGAGSAFTKILGADGMDCFIDPDGTSTYVASIQDGKFYYSTNSGSSFETVGDPETIGDALNKTVRGRWVTPVAEISGGTTQFVIGYKPVVKVTRVLAGVYSFADISGSQVVSGRTFIKTARNNSDRIYAGDVNTTSTTSNTVYREVFTTTNGGSTWSLIYDQTSGTPFTDLAFDADNGNRVWLTFGGYEAGKKVFYSSTGGGTATGDWTNISGSLPNVPINCIVFDDNNGSPSGAVYIGTDIGVFYRDDNLGDWIPFRNGMPIVEVTDLEIHEASGRLRAGTYGRGIWETELYSSCPSSISLSTANTQSFKPYFFQASQDVNSTAVHAGTGAYVYYKAGTEIILSPGFIMSAAVENEFKTVLGPCGGGVPSLLRRPVIPLRGFME